jgi:hypothetical protein
MLAFELILVSYFTGQNRQSDVIDFLNDCFGFTRPNTSSTFQTSPPASAIWTSCPPDRPQMGAPLS